MYNSNGNSNFLKMLNEAYPAARAPSPPKSPPKLNVITFPKGRILWHARLQWDDGGSRQNVMNSPDYLFTSPQISQALLHGVFILGNKQMRFVELTKLKVKSPLNLIEFKTSKNQVNYSKSKGINLKPFGTDDIKLIQYICGHVPELDGYRAQWDQDQVTICASAIKKKLERVSTKIFRRDQLPFFHYNVTFETPRVSSNAMYYMTMGNKRPGRRLVRNVKAKEKANATKRKQLRVRTFGVGKKTGSVKPAPTGTVFKRPTIIRKKKI
jgi:hypothetical protein